MRLVFDLDEAAEPALVEHFTPLARDFGMDWRLYDPRRRPRAMILVSKAEHCLNDLLYRARAVVVLNFGNERQATFGGNLVELLSDRPGATR